jgi:hypothetical protein
VDMGHERQTNYGQWLELHSVRPEARVRLRSLNSSRTWRQQYAHCKIKGGCEVKSFS